MMIFGYLDKGSSVRLLHHDFTKMFSKFSKINWQIFAIICLCSLFIIPIIDSYSPRTSILSPTSTTLTPSSQTVTITHVSLGVTTFSSSTISPTSTTLSSSSLTVTPTQASPGIQTFSSSTISPTSTTLIPTNIQLESAPLFVVSSTTSSIPSPGINTLTGTEPTFPPSKVTSSIPSPGINTLTGTKLTDLALIDQKTTLPIASPTSTTITGITLEEFQVLLDPTAIIFFFNTEDGFTQIVVTQSDVALEQIIIPEDVTATTSINYKEILQTELDGSKSVSIVNSYDVEKQTNTVDINAALPSSLTITGSSLWDGTLTLPTNQSIAEFDVTGFEPTFSFEFGEPNISLSFSTPIKFTLENQAGQDAAIQEPTRTAIIETICDNEDPLLVSNIPSAFPQACRIDSGTNLVILSGIGSKFAVGGVKVLALGAIATGGGGSSGSGSNFGDTTVSGESSGAGGFGGIIAELDLSDPNAVTILHPEDRLILRQDLYENQGINNIEHVSLYFGQDTPEKLTSSTTYIMFEKDEPLKISDPNGYFTDKTKFNILERDAYNFVLKYDIEFASPMPKSDMLLYMYDGDRNLSKKFFDDKIVVLPKEPEIILEQEVGDSNIRVPDWIKTSAGWWADDQITENGFAKGIEYWIQNDIMKLPPAEFLEENGATKDIPDWVRNTAGWWADGLIPDDDFVSGIKYLVEQGIILV